MVIDVRKVSTMRDQHNIENIVGGKERESGVIEMNGGEGEVEIPAAGGRSVGGGDDDMSHVNDANKRKGGGGARMENLTEAIMTCQKEYQEGIDKWKIERKGETRVSSSRCFSRANSDA